MAKVKDRKRQKMNWDCRLKEEQEFHLLSEISLTFTAFAGTSAKQSAPKTEEEVCMNGKYLLISILQV